MSLRAAESQTGISNSYLSQLEGGAISNPSPRHLWALAGCYSCSYAELMKLAGYVPPPGTPPSRLLAGLSELTDDEADRVAEFIELLRKTRPGQ